jgi:membrane protease YdiL (CAAX protease family)
MIERKPLIWFLVSTFVFSWIFFLVPLSLTHQDPQTRQSATVGLWALGMWGPGLSALLATRLIARQPLRSLRLHTLGPKRFYLWAWFLPVCLSIAGGIFTVLLGVAEFDPDFGLIRASIANAVGGMGIDPRLVILVQVAFVLFLAPFINLLFAMGEELGWRGFLLPRLLPIGQWKAILITSVIWGVWHAPAILQGLNYPGYPIPGLFMMIVFTTLLGIILAWLYLNTRSPWVAALGHGAVNAAAGLPVLFFKPGFNLAFGGSLATFPAWIGMGIFILWLVATRRLPVKVQAEETTQGPL